MMINFSLTTPEEAETRRGHCEMDNAEVVRQAVESIKPVDDSVSTVLLRLAAVFSDGANTPATKALFKKISTALASYNSSVT